MNLPPVSTCPLCAIRAPRAFSIAALFFLLFLASCSSDSAEQNLAELKATEQDMATGATPAQPRVPDDAAPVVTNTSVPAEQSIAWDKLPPLNTPADLVPAGYDGRFLAYATVIGEPEGPATLCSPLIRTSLPPQCDGVPIEGFDWASVPHESQAGTRWGGYVLIGHFDGSSFTLTEPAFEIDPSKVRQPDPQSQPAPPCPEPADGWWSDITDPERLGSEAHNNAVGVVNTRSELVLIEIFQPSSPVPATVRIDPDDTGWVPGVLVIQLAEVRAGDEEEIRSYWGGPLCLTAVERATRVDLIQVMEEVVDRWSELAPYSGLLDAGVSDGYVQLGVWIATADAQALLDEEYGVGVVRALGLLWALD